MGLVLERSSTMLREVDDRLELELDALLLTDAQREALVIHRHVVLSAGAGSGKTHTLAWRYVRLLLEHANCGGSDLDAVVVLTFTEKAAEEMAERCRHRLYLLTAAARAVAPEHPVTERLDGMLDRFESARIGTFHGFCARIQREFPTACGVGGDTDILEPVDAAVLRRTAVEQAVSTWLEARHPDLSTLLDTFGSRRALLGALDAALDRYGLLRQRISDHAEDQVELDLEGLAETTESLRQWLRSDGIAALRAIEQLTRPGGTPFWRAVKDCIQPVATEPLALHAQARAVLDVLVRPTGLRSLTHHTVLGKKHSWPDVRRYHQAKAALGVLAERLADWPERAERVRFLPTRADVRLLAALTPFSRLVQEARARHEDALALRRAVDFDALQDRAVDAVLRSEELRTTLRDRHRWLMVDEFQDTDPRQWAMVRALGDAGPGEAADRVFLVGDVKQAIYGFRGGEVRLFLEAADHLGVQTQELPDNFRSQEPLIRWFNRMFPRVLSEIWSPLEPVRPDEGGGVTWLVAESVPDQAVLTARFLAALPPDDIPGPSIAILLRTRTHLGVWERALREAAVPYRVAKGVGFWARQEVLDVVNLALAMITGDPLATIGALRSPLFGVHDQAIHDHWYERRGRPMHALDRLSELAWSRHDGPFAEVLADALDALDAWVAWDDGARANVHQLLDVLRSWNEPLPVLADRLARRIRDVPQESEATPGASRARVVLLTVHASKGLEFPMVVVPELQRRPTGRPAPLTIARLDGTYQMAAGVDDDEADVQSRATPSLLARARHEVRAATDAEYRRLLYVAATRARDRLVLVGPMDASERSWSGLLSDPPDDTEVLTLDDLPKTDGPVRPDVHQWSRPRRLPPLPPPPVDVSAGDLNAWSTCPARWFRQHRLGQTPPRHHEESDESADLDRLRRVAGVRGEVLHALLEDRAHGDGERARRRWAAAARRSGLTARETATGLDRLETQLRTLSQSDAVSRWLDAPGFDELGVRQPFDGGVFVGRLDRLVLDRELGGFVVVDWKTERVDAGVEGLDTLAERHRLQLSAYAWAARSILEPRDQPDVVGAVVVSTQRGTARVLDTDALHARIGDVLAEVAATRTLDGAYTRAADHDPPCEECPFFRHGCDGHVTADPSGSDQQLGLF